MGDGQAFRRRIERLREHISGVPDTPERRRFRAAMKERQPRFAAAVLADAREAAVNRGERFDHRSRTDAWVQVARLALVSDTFLAQIFYRAKAASRARGVPILPRVFHRLAISTGQICIGDPVIVAPGVYIPHGQVVIDGITEVGERTVLAPFITIGLIAGEFRGPVIGAGVKIGTGARVLGPLRIGPAASVGANAVVVDDVAAGATVVGIPARVVGSAG